MKKIVIYAWIAIISSTVTNVLAGVPLFPAFAFTVVATNAAIICWFVGSAAYDRINRRIGDATSLAAKKCPKCGCERLVEVTSRRDPANQRRVVCTECRTAYALVHDGDRVVAHRLGDTSEP